MPGLFNTRTIVYLVDLYLHSCCLHGIVTAVIHEIESVM